MRFPLARSPFPVLNLPLLEHGLLLLCEQRRPAAPVSSPPRTAAGTHCFWSTWYAPAPSTPKPIAAYAWPWKAGGVSAVRAAWLTFEDGSFLQAELEAASPESECAEAEDGREEGHGWWGGGGGGVGGGGGE